MFVELMQALFSVMPETAQQPMTDFRRLCLEAEEKSEFNAAPDDMDDGQQPVDPYADEIKRLEAEYGPFANGVSITVELKKLLPEFGIMKCIVFINNNRSIIWKIARYFVTL